MTVSTWFLSVRIYFNSLCVVQNDYCVGKFVLMAYYLVRLTTKSKQLLAIPISFN